MTEDSNVISSQEFGRLISCVPNLGTIGNITN